LYFFFVGLGTVLGHYRLIDQVPLPPLNVLSFLLLSGNFACFWSPPPPLIGSFPHLWSISVEEQFYLCWPLAVRSVSKRGLAGVALAMLAVACAARLASCLLGLKHTIWLDTFTRLDPIAIGILLAGIPRATLASLRPAWRVGLGLAGLLLVGVAAWLLVPRRYDPFFATATTRATMLAYPAAALGSGSLLVAFMGAGVMSPERGMFARALIYLGKISYGLYVYHLIAITVSIIVVRFINESYTPLGTEVWPLFALMSFSLTVILAAASYRWLESPFLRLKRRFTYVASRPV